MIKKGTDRCAILSPTESNSRVHSSALLFVAVTSWSNDLTVPSSSIRIAVGDRQSVFQVQT